MDESGTSSYGEDETREDVVDSIAEMGSSSVKWSSSGQWTVVHDQVRCGRGWLQLCLGRTGWPIKDVVKF
ncbi:hypothetical protein SESBI_03754 [Sesbania bispinosa]|nr:hypothetical protein SESBI_03754 [Sesbania bispinosa]